MSHDALQAAHRRLTDQATLLAGGLGELAKRAAAYHHLFRASRGNHAFPLIAAHGALWAGGHFRYGLKLGRILAWQYAWSRALRRRQIERLGRFADALRDINRRVCIDTYVNFYFTRQYGDDPAADRFVPPSLLAALRRVHRAIRTGRAMSNAERRAVFEAHFLYEQETVVGEAVRQAVAELDWPLVRFLALRPAIEFAFLPAGERIQFRDFTSRAERIRNGLRAFDLAARVGWEQTERALARYGVLSPSYLANPDGAFEDDTDTVAASRAHSSDARGRLRGLVSIGEGLE